MLKNILLVIFTFSLISCAAKDKGQSANEAKVEKSGPLLSVAIVSEGKSEIEDVLVQHILDHAFKLSNFDIIDQQNLKAALEQNSYNQLMDGAERKVESIKAQSKLSVSGFKRDDGTVLVSLKMVCNSGKMLHAVSEDVSENELKKGSKQIFIDLLTGLTGNNSNCKD